MSASHPASWAGARVAGRPLAGVAELCVWQALVGSGREVVVEVVELILYPLYFVSGFLRLLFPFFVSSQSVAAEQHTYRLIHVWHT